MKKIIYSIIFCLIVGNFSNTYASEKINKEAESYYKQGISINKKINQAKRINPNIDCTKLNETAIENFSKAIEIEPNYANAYFQRAEKVYEMLIPFIYKESLFRPMGIGVDKILSQTISDYSKVNELNSQNIEALFKKNFIKLFLSVDLDDEEYDESKHNLLVQKHLTSINEDIDKMISINPLYSNAYLLKGILFGFFFDGYDEDNKNLLFVERNQENRMLLLNNVPEDKKNAIKNKMDTAHKLAIQNFSTAISLNSRNSLAYIYRAHFLFKLNDYEGGIADLSSAISIEPYNADFYYMRADKKFYTHKIVENGFPVSVDIKGAYKDYLTAKNLAINTDSELYSMCMDKIHLIEEYHSDKI